MLTLDVTYRDQAANLRGFLAYEETAPGRAARLCSSSRAMVPIFGRL